MIRRDWSTLAKAVLIHSLLLTGLCESSVWAQKLPSTSAFLDEMETLMGTVSSREGRWFKKNFREAFEDKSVSDDIQKEVIETAYGLQERKVSNSQGMAGYLKGVHVLLNNQRWEDWKGWHGHLKHCIDKGAKRKDLQAYLSNSQAMFLSGLLYDSPAATWHFRGGQMEFTLSSSGEPVVRCQGGDLVCVAKKDSMRLYEASGVFDPMDDRWAGSSGLVRWDRTTREGELTATLGQHNIRLKGSSLSCEDARLTSTMFDIPLEGTLQMKVQKESKVEKRTYPRFESRSGRVVLEDIFPGLSFSGGLAIRGSKLSGKDSDGALGEVSFVLNDTLRFRCWSNDVQFTPDAVRANHGKMSFYLDDDSLYHPDISVAYLDSKRLLRATRQEEGVGLQPFQDSYHKVEFEVEVLEWEVDGEEVFLRALPNTTAEYAAFRSMDCFEIEVFNDMIGLDPIHPLSELSKFASQWGSDKFYTDEYARFIGLPEEQARMLLIGLTNFGYIDMDLATRFCTIKPRAERHMKCRKGVVDYDVLAFYSKPRGDINAALNLKDKLLHMEGIAQIQVSQAQEVYIRPDGGQLSLGKNRNFTFDGEVEAGRFSLRGNNFRFEYEQFQIGVDNASCRIKVEMPGEFDVRGNPVLTWIRTPIEEVTGTLEIDNPKNMSGWKSDFFTQYPILTSTTDSHVYYDDPMIQQGAYHRNRFNYELVPFVIDSLDNFSNKDLEFQGMLKAGNIVPDIQEPLKLMPDYSLGFTKSTPEEGYPLYGKHGNMAGTLSLDYSGLHGPGRIDFLTSHLDGNNHVFLPDSTFGETTLYVNDVVAGLLPVVRAKRTVFGLHPFESRLDVWSTPTDSLQFFDENVRLDGGLHLTPERMTGQGVFYFERAELASQSFSMKEHLIDADVASFQLTGTDLNEVAFGTDNVSAHVDFDARRGDFKAHDGASMIDLPAIRYQCLMDEFSWFMDEDKLDLFNSLIDPSAMTFQELSDRSQSNFFCTDEDQDGLHFLSPRATYQVEEAFVECHQVQSIAVADAEIKPGDGLVVIRREALMEELKGAEVYANDVTRYHRLFDANIRIKGRLSYEGAGTKTYVDNKGMEWPIRFHDLGVDTASRTIGRARIAGEEAFFLSPRFAFKGYAMLEAGREDLEFEGGAQMQFDCEEFANEWVEFKGVIDPEDVAIPIDSVITELGKAHLGVGWVHNDGGMESLYETFFTKKPVRDDVSFIQPQGKLRYDSRKSRYVVCSDDKLKNSRLPGNLTEIAMGNCGVTQQGQASFPFNGNKGLIDQRFAGDVYTQNGVMKLRGSWAIDMPMPKPLAEHLQQAIETSTAKELPAEATNYSYLMAELLGVDEAAQLETELDPFTQTYKKGVPKEARHAMVFHGLNWEYDPVLDMWVTLGDIGVATMDEFNVWASFKGKLAINRDKDLMHLYFHLGSNQWYYFEYVPRDGRMRYHFREMNLEEGETSLTEKMAAIKNLKFEEGAKELNWIPLGDNLRNRRNFVSNFREFDN